MLTAKSLSIIVSFCFLVNYSAYGQTLTGEQLLQYLQDFDSIYQSGLTVSGTFELDGMTKKWQLTTSPNQAAYQEDVVEVLDSRKIGRFIALRQVYYWGAELQAKYDFVGKVWETGKLTEWSRDSPGLAKAASLKIDDPDAPTYTLPLNRTLMCLGRRYSKYITEITDVKLLENGFLSVTANGFDRSKRPGAKWMLIIDPNAAYMVREAKLYIRGKDKPSLTVKNSGTKWHGSLCVPEKIEWQGFSRLTVDKPYNSVSKVTDEALLKYAKMTMKSPFLVHTDVSEQRMVPEFRTQYNAGQLFPKGQEGLDGDVLDYKPPAVKPEADIALVRLKPKEDKTSREQAPEQNDESWDVNSEEPKIPDSKSSLPLGTATTSSGTKRVVTWIVLALAVAAGIVYLSFRVCRR
jgi:hypothetical protein